ncbi:hypothetical protein BGX34_010770 [Mortierella sp. NVP85]|nr:hypothetical protein BGX34_010770 [Mortierella sp. NVP85]
MTSNHREEGASAPRRSRSDNARAIAHVENGISEMRGRLSKAPAAGKSFLSDYRKFVDRGNVMDLAVAVIIGAAFTAIVTSLVNDIITPLMAMASGKTLEESFVVLSFNADSNSTTTTEIAKSAGMITWNWGNFLQTVINFFIISCCVFVVVKAYQMTRNQAEATEKKCDFCFKSIPLQSSRCSNCTTWLNWDAYVRVRTNERLAELNAKAAVSSTMQGTY